MAKLTEKQRIFAEEYVANFGNGRQAAIKAGYSKKTAMETAYENLRKPHIQEYIARITEQVKNERIMSVEEALALSTAIARGQPQQFISKTIDPLTGEIIKQEEKMFSAGFKERNQALEHIYKANQVFDKKEESTDTTEDKLDELLDKISGELNELK